MTVCGTELRYCGRLNVDNLKTVEAFSKLFNERDFTSVVNL